MRTQQLWFDGKGGVSIREQSLSPPGPGEVLVRSLYSAVSAGTEMLVYRGQLPHELALDAGIQALQGHDSGYPMRYGYATVGRVIACGPGSETWQDRLVFCYQPHATHFLSPAADLLDVPGDISPENAVFLANMETAVNLVLDGRPLLGERVLIMGLGIVGLLVCGLLAGFPLAELAVFDRLVNRQSRARELGADPVVADGRKHHAGDDPAEENDGYDLIYELTGTPDVLNNAIELCGYAGRIIVGSWYGTKCAPLNLGGRYHRQRIQLISSQVSTITPGLTGRWSRERRHRQAFAGIKRLDPQRFISHRFAFTEAANLYSLLDHEPENVLQALLVYPDA